MGPSRKVKAAVRKAVKSIHDSPEGHIEMLTRLFRSKFGISGKEILFSSSLRELLFAIAGITRPAKVLIVGPALPIYEEAVRAAQAEVSYCVLPLDGEADISIAQLLDQARDADLLFLANPNRLSGRLVSGKLLGRLFSLSSERGSVVVVDESLSEFCSEHERSWAAQRGGNVMFLWTTALFYGMPGLELAAVISSPARIGELREIRPWELNTLSVEAARTALTDGTYKRQIRKLIHEERTALIRSLSRIEGLRCDPTDSNVFLVRSERDMSRVLGRLRHSGIVIQSCGDIAGLDDRCLRIAVMKHDHNLKLARMLRPSGDHSPVEEENDFLSGS